MLSLTIVLINIITYQGMDNDATIINYSGKLRALSYSMSQVTNQLNNHGARTNLEELRRALKLRMDEFDSIILMFDNNQDIKINHNDTVTRLESISREWNESFKHKYQSVIADEDITKHTIEINSEIDIFVNKINDMVLGYSKYAREKVYKALMVNAGLVIIIIILTAYSFFSTNKRIRRPINLLMKELKELSLIDDEISKKLKNLNTDEISEMGHYFDVMMFDQLTKTFNRRSGLAKLNRLFQSDNRRNMKMSLCFIDINGLKEVNDKLGHKFGDELIVSAVECIKHEIGEEDFIIRMGGDEFLIVFVGIDTDLAEKVWLRISQRYQAINNQENRAYNISVSHGIVEHDNSERSEIEFLIKRADDKMYSEKKYIKEELKVKIIKD